MSKKNALEPGFTYATEIISAWSVETVNGASDLGSHCERISFNGFVMSVNVRENAGASQLVDKGRLCRMRKWLFVSFFHL